MKKENGIKTIAMKVSAEELENKRAFALTVLGGREIYTEPGLAVFLLADGQIMELYGPGSSYPGYLFEKNDVVISFRVSDLRQAVKNMIAAGMELLSEVRLGSCSEHCYMKDRSGTVFGLTD